MSSFGTVKRGLQQLLHAFEVPGVEPGEQVEARDELAGVEADVEARRRLGALRALDAVREVAVDLRGDQAPFVQGLVAPELAAQRRLAQESRFERGRIVLVLAAEGVERRLRPLEARLEHRVDELADAFAEDRARALGAVAGKLLDEQARHQQRLETVAEPVGEKAADAEAAIDEIGGAERQGEGERGLRGALVAEPPAAPRALDQRVGVAHQHLQRGGRRRPARQRLEDEHALLVAERDERDRQPLVLGEPDLLGGVAGAGGFRPRLIGRERARQRPWDADRAPRRS